MRLIRPNRDELKALFGKTVRGVWVCSPWISTAGVEMLQECLERCDLKVLHSLELWTRLDVNDYKFGLSDYPAINRLIDLIRRQSPSTQFSLWAAPHLHAKIIWTDLGALVGSANLSSAGFTKNVEASIRLESKECIPQASMREVLRQSLSKVSLQQWNSFLAELEVSSAHNAASIRTYPPADSGDWDDLLRQLLSEGFPFDRGIR